MRAQSSYRHRHTPRGGMSYGKASWFELLESRRLLSFASLGPDAFPATESSNAATTSASETAYGRSTTDATRQADAATAISVGQGWTSDQVNAAFTDSVNSSYVFTLAQPGFFRITDAYEVGDQYYVYDAGQPILTTAAFAGTPFGDNSVADAAWSSLSFQGGEVLLQPGAHSISVQGNGGGGIPAGFFVRLDTGNIVDLNLTQATTFDAHSVTVSYTVGLSDITAPLKFDVYRSDKPDQIDADSQLLGSETVPASDISPLSIGDHTEILDEATTSLPPDQQNHLKNKYIVVIADSDGSVGLTSDSQPETYFQTFLVAAISHGYQLGLTNNTDAWELNMARDLKVANYDDAIAFNWVKESTQKKSGQATAAGDRLYSAVVTLADNLAKPTATHSGDVVDLHFIGHSRGAVVISRAMQDLIARQSTDLAIKGSFIKATFLDPHPANATTQTLASANSTIAAKFLANQYRVFSKAADDPQVVIPSNVGSAEVYYQHTAYSAFGLFTTEWQLNLWGEGPSNGIINNSTATIHYINLTGVTDPVLGVIGHTEVHEWYHVKVINAGLAALVT